MGVLTKFKASLLRRTIAKAVDALKKQTVADIMTKYVISVRTDDTVIHAATKMIAEDISCLLVMDEDELKGIISERDFMMKVPFNKKVFNMKVSNIMTSNPVTVPADKKLTEAVALMKKNNFRRLVVADGEKVLGIVTQTDFSNAVKKGFSCYPLHESLTVDAIMSKNVLTATPKESFSKARDKMKKINVGSILIMDKDIPLGIFTEYDVVMQFYDQEGQLRLKELSDYMRKHVRAVNTGMNILCANKLLLDKNMRRLPIVRDKKIIGIVTQTDIVRFLYLNLDKIIDAAGKTEEFGVFPREFEGEFHGEHFKVYG